MLIKRKVKASTDTHNGNGGDVKFPKSDTEITNNDSADQLIDPEDFYGGDTHTKITASTDEQNISTIDNDEDPAEDYLPIKTSATDIDPDTTNISTIDNDEDPAAGYLPTKTSASDDLEDDDEFVDGEDDDEDDESDDTEIDASEDDELLNQQSSDQSLILPNDDEADWDADTVETADFVDDEDEDDTSDADEDGDDTEDGDDEEIVDAGADDMNLLDVDGTDDVGEDVVFATVRNTVHVIKANRIIASMNKKIATTSNRQDVYLSDRFAEVVEAQVKTAGLRKGLRAMGFALAKVNVKSPQVVEARVQKGVKLQAAAIRKVNTDNAKAFDQSLAIAAVGINRSYFKDVPNELKAHLESELQLAGVRGGTRLIRQAFAEFGPSYAKQIVELANKISTMPAETRNGLVAALDMTNEDMEENPFGSVENGDYPGDTTDDVDGVDGDAEFDDDFIEDIQSPVTAAFTNPARKIKTQAALLRSNHSVSLQAVLSGESALPFAF